MSLNDLSDVMDDSKIMVSRIACAFSFVMSGCVIFTSMLPAFKFVCAFILCAAGFVLMDVYCNEKRRAMQHIKTDGRCRVRFTKTITGHLFSDAPDKHSMEEDVYFAVDNGDFITDSDMVRIEDVEVIDNQKQDN